MRLQRMDGRYLLDLRSLLIKKRGENIMKNIYHFLATDLQNWLLMENRLTYLICFKSHLYFGVVM